jgi:CheY-like chemotaxis protein
LKPGQTQELTLKLKKGHYALQPAGPLQGRAVRELLHPLAVGPKPDVILMDVVMPGKTGIEAIPNVLHDAPEAKS